MATQPDVSPDRIDPQSPSEVPGELPNEQPTESPDETFPLQPDHDEPGRGPMETPPPPD